MQKVYFVFTNKRSDFYERRISMIFEGNPVETDITSKLSNRGKASIEQLLGSEETNNCKGAGLGESQSEIWVRVFDIEKLQ